MNRWRQTKRYRCPKCNASYLHDEAHFHHCYACPARPLSKPKARPVFVGKTYAPKPS